MASAIGPRYKKIAAWTVAALLTVGIGACGSSAVDRPSQTGRPAAETIQGHARTLPEPTRDSRLKRVLQRILLPFLRREYDPIPVKSFPSGCLGMSARSFYYSVLSTGFGVRQCLTVVNAMPWPIGIGGGTNQGEYVYKQGRLRSDGQTNSMLGWPIQPGDAWSMPLRPGSSKLVDDVVIKPRLAIDAGLNGADLPDKPPASLAGIDYQNIMLGTEWRPFAQSRPGDPWEYYVNSPYGEPVPEKHKNRPDWVEVKQLVADAECARDKYAVESTVFVVAPNPAKVSVKELVARMPELSRAAAKVSGPLPQQPDAAPLIADLSKRVPGVPEPSSGTSGNPWAPCN